VAAQSKAWTVFTRSKIGVVGSNPTKDMDAFVRLFCFCAVLCAGRVLRRADPPSKESYQLSKNQETEKAAKIQQKAVER
jgi:hypothetical protein